MADRLPVAGDVARRRRRKKWRLQGIVKFPLTRLTFRRHAGGGGGPDSRTLVVDTHRQVPQRKAGAISEMACMQWCRDAGAGTPAPLDRAVITATARNCSAYKRVNGHVTATLTTEHSQALAPNHPALSSHTRTTAAAEAAATFWAPGRAAVRACVPGAQIEAGHAPALWSRSAGVVKLLIGYGS